MIPISVLLRKLSCLIVLIVFTLLGTAASQPPSSGPQHAMRSVSVVGGGTLSWNLMPNADGCFDFWNFGPFSYTSPTGVVTSFNAGAYYFQWNFSSCNAPQGALPTSLTLNGPTFTITFYPGPGGSGTATLLGNSVFDPLYQVVSILYAPPGNKSQDGFTNTTTDGTTSTIGSSFQYGQTMTFSFGWGTGSVGASLGATSSTSTSTAFQETFTDASGVANASQTTNPDAINHNQDLFLIWVNPQVTVASDGSIPVNYSMGIQPTANGATPGADVLEITANVMEANSAGVTTVPATWLNQQYNTATGQYTPGLAAICKNLITAEYSAGTCTLNDQCGCTPTDFAPILQMDPLLYQNGISNPISPYLGTVSPLNANISPGCGTLPIPSGLNCRYIPVPSGIGSLLQEVVTLSGPDYPGGDNSPNTFTQTENTQTTQTFGESNGESVGVSVKFGGGLGPSLTIADTWTWTNSQSIATAGGSGSTLTVTLNSSTVGCGQDIPVYEDTEFHTFVFQQPANNDSCMAVPTFSPLAGTYATAQTVSISYPTSGATIYYTTNGTTPTTSSSVYTGPITVSSNETIQAIATVSGYANSATGSAAYTIN